MAVITLTDSSGIQFEIDSNVINEVHRCGEQVEIVDNSGKKTVLSDSMEDLIMKLLKANNM